MTTYSWSTITTTQGLSFVAADILVFDAGGNARDIGVAIGVATTALTYAGKTISVNNSALAGAKANFLFTDGSNLGVNASGANPGAVTLSALNDAYYSENDTASAGIDSVSGGLGNDIFLLGDQNDTGNGDAGDDTMNGNLGSDSLLGGAGADSISGGQGDDTVGGQGAVETGNDSLNGNIGNDNVSGEGGNE